MTRQWWAVGVAACALSLGACAWADPQPGPRDVHAAQDPKQLWSEAKASLKQGAYRAALQAFDVLLTLTPNDPWAQVYHSLCEQRLQSSQVFAQISPAELSALKERLRQEERQQRRASAQQKIFEREIRQEQVKWNKELDALQRQTELDQKRKRLDAQAEAVQRAKADQAKARELAQQQALGQPVAAPAIPAAASPSPAPPSPPGASEPGAPVSPPIVPALATPPTVPPQTIAPQGSVELPKVVVPTTPEGAVAQQASVTPSLVGRPKPPPGSAQINAQQMSVSPDRHIAVADGDVEIVFQDAILTCDHLTLFTDTKDVYAEGHVRLEEGNQVFRGEIVHYNFQTKKGRFLQGTVSSPPWIEHGRTIEHIAEGVFDVSPGSITSCELEPPHFEFAGRRAIVFANDGVVHTQSTGLFVDRVPIIYFPWLSIADRQSPFFIIPGKRKPWGHFALMGYRYELPGPGSNKGTFKLDWRRFFGWGTGFDHEFHSQDWGKGLFKFYYNEMHNRTLKKEELPKGAGRNRYRALWRHLWNPLPDTTVVTDIQKYSDIDFRKDFLFREEYVKDGNPESFVSLVTNDPNYNLALLLRRRFNRFQSVTEAYPEATVSTRSTPIGQTNFFTDTSVGFSNLQTKNAHSEIDTDVVKANWSQSLSYGMNWFRPIELTPKISVNQTYYTKDKQGGIERPDGRRNEIVGQVSGGTDASLKLFKIFPITTNVMGLNIHWLRHIVTPTVSYHYVAQPTAPNANFSFPASANPRSDMTLGLENKLQTKRAVAREPGAPQGKQQYRNVDVARFLLSTPYTFRGTQNKQGGRLGDWAFDLELYPWPWLRFETDWSYPSHYVKGSSNTRVPTWNFDLVMVGGQPDVKAQQQAQLLNPDIQAPEPRGFVRGPQPGIELMPMGHWYLGLGHRFSANDKTEDVIQFDWRLSPKWQIGTFHRFTEKEVKGSVKRFNNVREYQYTLRRDLHDWMAEFVYQVDREYGEEIFLTLTLKAYPDMPIAFGDSYHQPKFGSQSSPFSPIRSQ